ncbi:MAG TPA: hypothetical protein VJ728_09530 [Candidatus Binataceae bacterium]|nr:hypothetical protein [Candidatus Binataceae bacterium]
MGIKKLIKWVLYAAAGLFGLFVLLMAYYMIYPPVPPTPAELAAQKAKAEAEQRVEAEHAKREAEQAAKEKAEEAKHKAETDRISRDTAWATTFAKALRNSMRNPASFELNEVLVMDDNSVCFTYRAQNGFGGINVDQAVLTPRLKFRTAEQPGFSPLWARYCHAKRGFDETRNVNTLM